MIGPRNLREAIDLFRKTFGSHLGREGDALRELRTFMGLTLVCEVGEAPLKWKSLEPVEEMDHQVFPMEQWAGPFKNRGF